MHIPPQRPNSKECPVPIMTLVGVKGTHPWLDDRMTVVGYGPISSESEFRKSRLLLSQVVNAVVQHFQLNPPTNLMIMDKSLQKMQASQREAATRTQQTSGHEQHGNGNGQAPPSYPSPQKKDVSDIHFSEVITLNASDKQQIKSMIQNYVSIYFFISICLIKKDN